MSTADIISCVGGDNVEAAASAAVVGSGVERGKQLAKKERGPEPGNVETRLWRRGALVEGQDDYFHPGEHCVERYTNVPVIIRRPFTEDVDLFPTPPNFKMPLCESYDGTRDLMEHLTRFTSSMNLHLVPDQIMCRPFPVMLEGAAHVWFQHLTPRFISCWAQLAESFRSNFLMSHIQRKKSSALFCIAQGSKESLKSYYACFNIEKLLIDHLDLGVIFTAMARGVRPRTPLRFSLNK
ncbi:hypothetical protein RJ639_043424 [Escallonia herrerae]|uniref:Retrotransposon gag domain-containing protein n=1 Tax=Escallonia herrerae TaxID=1293975 RepID=A0AA88WCB8_9ASTE|nr:hypothetical protein RJ639_043424 [Escallonia herrerae]